MMPRAGRILRSTRKGKDVNKDWSKLHEGSPLPDDSDGEDAILPCPSTTKINKKKKKAEKKRQQKFTSKMEVPVSVESVADERSGIVHLSEEDLTRTDDINKYGSGHNTSSDDDEIREAERSLQKLKLKESRVRKEERLKKIEEEAKRIKKSLKQRGTRKLTTADLRSMDDVRHGVDKYMDEKKLNFKGESGSETDDASSDSSSRSSSSSESEHERKRKEKSADKKKKKSGKESKLTSYVKFPQKWPHSHLKHHFVAKDKKYDELSLAEFCAGYSSILRKCKSSKKARIEHLEELMYHATTKPWRHVLNYHAACLLEIERGNLKWGDNFQLCGVGNMTLYGAGSHSVGSVRRDQNTEIKQHNSGNDERVWFCKNFQRGACTFTRDHYGQLMGQNQLLKHICAKCWLTVKKQFPHSEQSESCPLFKVEL